MKNSTAFKFVDRYLKRITEWVVRFAEILALEGLFLFGAIHTHSWMLGGFVMLLSFAIVAHMLLGFHALMKEAAPEEAKRTERGENEAAVLTRREKMIGAAAFGAIGFAAGFGTSWVVVEIMVANAR